MLSFHQLLKQKPQQPNHPHCLFTQLKNNIMNNPHVPIMESSQHSYEKIMETYELDFNILRLEKAHLIANIHGKTGQSVKTIMKSVLSGLSVQIENIINGEPEQMVNTKGTSHLQSTFGRTNDSQSQAKPIKSGEKSLSLTPKIVQFTLGANKSISSSAKQKHLHSSEGDVSEFMVGSKGQVSKSIREKVMGSKKIK